LLKKSHGSVEWNDKELVRFYSQSSGWLLPRFTFKHSILCGFYRFWKIDLTISLVTYFYSFFLFLYSFCLLTKGGVRVN
jgi:hypothetical protein